MTFDTRTVAIPTSGGVLSGEHTHFMGDPSDPKNRQWADAGSPGYHDDVNIAYPANEVSADVYMVPSFQGKSGQPDNQSTNRPMGSI
jgi:hypothetical protein